MLRPIILATYVWLSSFIPCNAQLQIPFGNFEIWEGSDTLYENPLKWSSLNEIHHLLGYTNFTITRVESNLEGLFAMQAQTQKFCNEDSNICFLVPGMAVLGDLYVNPFDLSVVTPGLAFSERPESLLTYYKYFPVLEDTFRIVVELSRSLPEGGKQIVALGDYQSADLTPNFAPLRIELNYFVNDNPDRIRIAIYSGVRNESYFGSYENGSRLVLDDMTFSSLAPTSINSSPSINASLVMFPVPVTDELRVELSGVPMGAYRLGLYSATGQMLRNQELYSTGHGEISSTAVSFSDLSAGSYLIRVTDERGQEIGSRRIPLIR